MLSWKGIGGTVLALMPAFILGIAAIPHFEDGYAMEAAVPVPNYMLLQKPLPKSAYVAAETALQDASPYDGEARILRAEAAINRGSKPPQSQIEPLKLGLALQPASARGWTLLAMAYAPVDRKQAASALAMAFMLAPRDYFLAGLRVKEAAILWSDLDTDAQENALDQARMLWDQPQLREQLRWVLTSEDGRQIVAKAFAGRQDDIREMNRWLSVQRSRDVLAR
jgi:hypothetical protein